MSESMVRATDDSLDGRFGICCARGCEKVSTFVVYGDSRFYLCDEHACTLEHDLRDELTKHPRLYM